MGVVSWAKHRTRGGGSRRGSGGRQPLGRAGRGQGRSGRRVRVGTPYGLLALAGVMLAALWGPGAPALASLPLGVLGGGASGSSQTVSRALPLCGKRSRANCVVDGDTLWIGGEKIRVADINTPETAQPGCAHEKRLGEKAKQRLVALVNQGPFELKREGRDEDRYGRKLRVLVRGGKSLGMRLVAEGLAEPWTGRRRDWCA